MGLQLMEVSDFWLDTLDVWCHRNKNICLYIPYVNILVWYYKMIIGVGNMIKTASQNHNQT